MDLEGGVSWRHHFGNSHLEMGRLRPLMGQQVGVENGRQARPGGLVAARTNRIVRLRSPRMGLEAFGNRVQFGEGYPVVAGRAGLPSPVLFAESFVAKARKRTAFPSFSRLDLDANASVSLSRYFYHGLLRHSAIENSGFWCSETREF